MVEFGILGPLQVMSEGRQIAVTAPKQRALLAVMLVHANQVVSADRLIDAVWGDSPPSTARRTLRYHISKLRDALEPGRSKGTAADSLLVTEGSGYRLVAEPAQIDAGRFEEEYHGGRRAADPVEAAAKLQAALDLWRGPAFAEFEYEEYANPEIARLEELRITCTEERIAADLAAGQGAELVGELESMVAQYPYRERLRALLMTALYRTGRQAEALQAYQAARRVLGEELGIDPSPELRELEERILLQDQSLTEVGPSARLPTGTVTFLFTDIEGSTRKWEQDPEAMRDALATHDEVVRRLISDHHGSIFKHTGDGVAAAFTSAMEAVSAAVDIRAAIESVPWEVVGGLRVKQALTTGEVEPRDGDYFGTPVNLAARMAGVGYGGQVLVGEATVGVIAGRLPEGWTLIDLGKHRLRHIAQPTTIHQLQEAGDRKTHPPLRAGGSLHSNLPEPITPFIGRQAELVAVRRAVTTHRLVALTGIGGIGKTRLALQTAAGLLDDFEHGVFHVDATTLDSVDPLAEALAHVIIVEPGDEPSASLLRALRDRQVLIVIEGIEALPDSGATLIAQILQGCPRVSVLVTSRVAPQIPGGVVWAVPPLVTGPEGGGADATKSDAVRLFVDRARLVDPQFTITHGTGPLVDQICRRLEGIPLALELAAARLKVMSLEDLAASAGRGTAAPIGSSTAGDRRRAVEASLQWSFAQLDESGRHLMGCLAVFRGGFDLAAAEGVCGGPAPDENVILDMLDQLVDISLVSVDRADGVRYGMLETVRHYAIDHATALPEAVRDRHANHYADVAAEGYELLAGPDEHIWLRRMDRERANFDAAVTWALGQDGHPAALRLVGNLGRFWLAAGYRRDAQRWLYAIQGIAPSLDGARLLAGRVWLAMEQGNLGEMAGHVDVLSALAAELEDPAMLSEATKWQGNVLMLRGKTEAAASRFEDATNTALEAGLSYAAVATVWLGWASLALGRWDRAESCGGWLLDQNARPAEAWRLIGRSEMGRGDGGAALRALERAIDAADEAGLPLHQIYARLDAAAAARGDNNPAVAEALAMEARDRAEQIGASTGRNVALRLLIAIARDAGNNDHMAMFEEELARTTASGDDPPRQQVILPGEGPLSGEVE